MYGLSLALLFSDLLGSSWLYGLTVLCLVRHSTAYCLLQRECLLPMSTKLPKQWWSKRMGSVWWLSSILLSDQVTFLHHCNNFVSTTANFLLFSLPLCCQAAPYIMNTTWLKTTHLDYDILFFLTYVYIYVLCSPEQFNVACCISVHVQEFPNKHLKLIGAVMWWCNIINIT